MLSADAIWPSAGNDGVMRKFSTFKSQLRVRSTASRDIFKRELPVQPVPADTLREFNEVHVLFH